MHSIMSCREKSDTVLSPQFFLYYFLSFIIIIIICFLSLCPVVVAQISAKLGSPSSNLQLKHLTSVSSTSSRQKELHLSFYSQSNLNASRKVILPLIQQVLQDLDAASFIALSSSSSTGAGGTPLDDDALSPCLLR